MQFVISLAVLAFFEAIVRGFTLSVLWGWFVVQPFGFRPLSIAEAIGLMLVISFATSQYIDNDQENKKSGLEVLLVGIGYPLVIAGVALSVGFVTTFFL